MIRSFCMLAAAGLFLGSANFAYADDWDHRGHRSSHSRYHDDLDHRAFHRELDHREAHRHRMSHREHEALHDHLDHRAYHDYLEHRAAHRARYYAPSRSHYYRRHHGHHGHHGGYGGVGINTGRFSFWLDY